MIKRSLNIRNNGFKARYENTQHRRAVNSTLHHHELINLCQEHLV